MLRVTFFSAIFRLYSQLVLLNVLSTKCDAGVFHATASNTSTQAGQEFGHSSATSQPLFAAVLYSIIKIARKPLVSQLV